MSLYTLFLENTSKKARVTKKLHLPNCGKKFPGVRSTDTQIWFMAYQSKGRTTQFFPKFAFFCNCHNFFPLSSVQIIIIPACCLLCVL